MIRPQLARDHAETWFACFGPNKRREIARLLYDICRREKTSDVDAIVPPDILAARDFFQLKAYLLKRCFPSLTEAERKNIPPLADLVFPPGFLVETEPMERPSFRNVFYERDVSGSPLLARLRMKLPGASFEEIPSYRAAARKVPFTVAEYNRRRETLFIIRERYDFFLHCPCSKPSRPCGYHILNAGMGCGFDCAYCYLQGYVNAPGIVLPGNLDEILQRFPEYYRSGMRLGTGQFTDSLFLDDLTGFASQLIGYFGAFPDVCFEFKTKSVDVAGILAVPPPGNIVVSWSLNPPSIISCTEFGTASLDKRLDAAHACTRAGYRVGFHFDPIIFYDGWAQEYIDVVKRIFKAVPADQIAWISLGCLRMTLKVRNIMEQRFPDTPLLMAEQVIGYDGKLRYPERVRRQIYQIMLEQIREFSSAVSVYLCMEDPGLSREFGIGAVKGIPRVDTA